MFLSYMKVLESLHGFIGGFPTGREKITVSMTGGPSLATKILPAPNRPLSPLFDQSLSPSTDLCPRKFQKFYLIFLSILTTF